MFSCPLHHWSSHEFPCPACYTTVTSSTDVPEKIVFGNPKEVNISRTAGGYLGENHYPEAKLSTPCPECQEMDREIVRLKELIRIEYEKRLSHIGHSQEGLENLWVMFCKINNL